MNSKAWRIMGASLRIPPPRPALHAADRAFARKGESGGGLSRTNLDGVPEVRSKNRSLNSRSFDAASRDEIARGSAQDTLILLPTLETPHKFGRRPEYRPCSGFIRGSFAGRLLSD